MLYAISGFVFIIAAILEVFAKQIAIGMMFLSVGCMFIVLSQIRK